MFDWNSFWINIIAGSILFILGIIFSIWVIPKFTLKVLNKKDKTLVIKKIASIIQELCEFLINSQFRDSELNQEHVSIFTSKKDMKHYQFVGLCPTNVFNNISHLKMQLVIYEYFKKLKPDDAYFELTKEYSRLKILQTELEKIISVHSHFLNSSLILKISELCSNIRKHEIQYSVNVTYNDLLEKTNNKREGIFGLNEIPEIYKDILLLIKELSGLKYFEYSIDKNKK
jgi:hypothetical protein